MSTFILPNPFQRNKRDYNTAVLRKAARDSTDKELHKRAIDITAKVKDDKMSIKKVVGVKKNCNKWNAFHTGKQVGKVTMILADAIYCCFLADKAVQTGKEFRTDTIKNATTIDSATAPAPATTRIAKKGKQSGQKQSSDQISCR